MWRLALLSTGIFPPSRLRVPRRHQYRRAKPKQKRILTDGVGNDQSPFTLAHTGRPQLASCLRLRVGSSVVAAGDLRFVFSFSFCSRFFLPCTPETGFRFSTSRCIHRNVVSSQRSFFVCGLLVFFSLFACSAPFLVFGIHNTVRFHTVNFVD